MIGMLEGKSVLVTGGARGIGKAAAELFAREGAHVVVADIREYEAKNVADKIGRHAVGISVDIADRASTDAAVAVAVDRFGRLDAAFNNAGISASVGYTAMADYPDEESDRLIAINQMGVWNCMRSELQHMLQNGGGAIVNTSSLAGILGYPGMSPYVAAKHAVIGLSRAAAIEYAAQNIRVNALLPGVIDTPMNSETEPAGWKDAIAPGQPSKRVGRPEEVAEAACWLLSDRASYVNAQSLCVDGGWSEALL